MGKVPDEAYNQNWVSLLNIFKKINRHEVGAKEKYLSLIELAKTKLLTPHQIDGILGRCQYQISLIDNPEQEPWSNMEKAEKRLTLPKEQSNGKQ
jgi:hypothetical protein